MEIEALIEIASNRDLLSEDVVKEILTFGISEFLKAGCSYTEALSIIEKATCNSQRIIYQDQFTGPRVEELED